MKKTYLQLLHECTFKQLVAIYRINGGAEDVKKMSKFKIVGKIMQLKGAL